MAGAEDRRPALADQPIPELLKQLSEQTQTLVRQELELAKAEMTEKGKRAGLGAGMFGGAGVVGFFAFAALTACLIAAIGEAIPVWAAALAVTALYALVAAVLALRGRKEIQQATPPKPDQTVETIKEDVQWAKNPTRSDVR